MSGEDLWVGIDLGTGGVRALAVAGNGTVEGSASRPLESRREDGRHEQDPAAWWEAAALACREAVEGLAPERVRGVAVDGTSGTIVLVDATGKALTPALMYDDGRANAEALRANELGGELWAELGHRMQPAWALPKLLWMLAERPELCASARLAHQPDLVTRNLVGGEVASDASHALKSGYDLLRERWPVELLEPLGVPEGLLPAVARPGSVLGEVTPDAGARTGLPAGTPVIAGMTDGCAAQLAAGALSEGSWNSVLGTTLALKGVSDELVRDPNGVLYCHRSPGGGWLPGGASSAGAGVLERELPGADLDALTRSAAEHEGTEVLAYPLVGRGERFPFAAAGARPFVLGEPAGDGERLAALLAGLAFTERLCFDYLDLIGAPTGGALSLTGGAARNRYLCRLRADVLGRAVTLPRTGESAFGMAVLAAAAGGAGPGGRIPLAEAAGRMSRMREVIEPRVDRSPRLLERYAAFVAELERRGWLGGELAGHARARAGRS